MNPVFCVFISLGLWLELNLKSNPSAIASPYVFSFSNNITMPGGGQKAKDIAQSIFGQNVFKREVFEMAGLLGSHSIHRFAATHVRKCGISKDDKDIQGRGKGKGRVSDVYDDVEFSYPDCKVAEKLCFGLPCFYLIDNTVVDVTIIMTTFILTKVVPNICQRLPTSACLVLGKAVVWHVFSSFANNFVSSMDYCDQVKAELVETGVVIEEAKNPILKMPVLVGSNQGTVYIDEIPVVAPVDNVEVAATAGGGGEQINLQVLENTRTFGGDQMRNYILQLQSGILSLRRENIELRNEFERRFMS